MSEQFSGWRVKRDFKRALEEAGVINAYIDEKFISDIDEKDLSLIPDSQRTGKESQMQTLLVRID
ncbi:MAG: hypothetical protein M3044_05070 [Thermoproteota archaeon]|nr:hypothetical protein [Thermoproteota archaeon]